MSIICWSCYSKAYRIKEYQLGAMPGLPILALARTCLEARCDWRSWHGWEVCCDLRLVLTTAGPLSKDQVCGNIRTPLSRFACGERKAMVERRDQPTCRLACSISQASAKAAERPDQRILTPALKIRPKLRQRSVVRPRCKARSLRD